MGRGVFKKFIIKTKGLSATIEPHLGPHVKQFFRAMLVYDGEKLAKAIIALSENHFDDAVADNEAFIQELKEKSVDWRRLRQDPEKYKMIRSRAVIKDVLESCRRYRLELHPTILVASVSSLTLEGWQFELDPTLRIIDNVGILVEYADTLERWFGTLDQSMRDAGQYMGEFAGLFR